jgi:hypothetical protein
LTAQTPFDLGHEIFRKPQGIEGLLESLSRLLRLAAITCEARLGCEAATLFDFHVFFDGSGGGRHGALLDSVWVFGSGSVPKHT